MISITAQVSGSQIAGDLTDDIEELAYCLDELSKRLAPSDLDEIAEHFEGMALDKPALKRLGELLTLAAG
jgi:hypothetical protein